MLELAETRVWLLNIREDKTMKNSKRDKLCSDLMELDRISNLPGDIAEKILSHLPIRDAVRTSVLSTKWRYKSAMLPHLVFDISLDINCIRSGLPSMHVCTRIINIVDHVLSRHIGSIQKFKLAYMRLSPSDIDRWILHLSKWILHLSRNSVKEFILGRAFGHYQPYVIPSCIFAWQDLIHLELHKCMLQPPSTFKGFKSLIILHFEKVTLDQDVLENLTCSSLPERLTLRNCEGFRQLKIDAANLQLLDFAGVVEDISILNTLNLVEVSISLNGESSDHCTRTNLIKVLANRFPIIFRGFTSTATLYNRHWKSFLIHVYICNILA